MECLSGTNFKDCLNAGTEGFEKLRELTVAMIDSKPRAYNKFDFLEPELRPSAKVFSALSEILRVEHDDEVLCEHSISFQGGGLSARQG